MQGSITSTGPPSVDSPVADEVVSAEAMARFAAAQGFEHCLYQAHVYPPMTRPTILRAGSCPDGWPEAYAALDLCDTDPWIRHAQGHCSPWLWDAEGQHAPPSFWQEALRHGMRHGCTFPLRMEHGVIGALTFTRASHQVSLAEYAQKAAQLLAYAQDQHLSVLRQRLPQLLHRPGMQLSERERAILKWTADGKTSSEIGLIMGLTQRTINFHVSKAALKLNSTNKTQAALKAAVLGLLF